MALLLASLLQAAGPDRLQPQQVEGSLGDLHVLLRGEDRSVLLPLPVQPDRRFAAPQWTVTVALAELERTPAAPRAAPSVPAGLAVPPGPVQPARGEGGATPAPAAPAAGRPAPEGPAGQAFDSRDLPSPASAGARVDPAAGSEPGERAAETEGIPVLPPVPPVLPLAPSLLAAPAIQERSLASVRVSYRAGHRLEWGGRIGAELPDLAAGIELLGVAADRLVPSALTSASGLAGRARALVSLSGLWLSMDAALVGRQSQTGASSRGALAQAAVSWEPGPLSVRLDASAASSAAEGAASGLSLEQHLGVGVSIRRDVLLRADLRGVFSREQVWSGAGQAGLAVEAVLGSLPLRASAGLGAASHAGLISLFPQAALSFSPSPNLLLAVEVEPLFARPIRAEELLLEYDPPAGPPAPERGTSVHASCELRGRGSLLLRAEARFAAGQLWLVRSGSLEIVEGRSLTGALVAEAALGEAGTLALTVSPELSWSAAQTAGLSALVLHGEALLGFWEVDLAGILLPAEGARPRGASWPAWARPAAAGRSTLAARLERRGSVGSAWAGLWLFLGGAAGPELTGEIGASIGVR